MNGFAVVKNAPMICAGKIFKTACGNVFKLNGSQDI